MQSALPARDARSRARSRVRTRGTRLLIGGIVALCTAAACGRPPAEAAIRARIDTLAAAVERGDEAPLLAILHPAFHGRDAMSRPELLMLVRHARRGSDVHVTTSVREVELRGEDEARVRLVAAASDTRVPTPGARADIWRIDSEWVFHRGDWTVRRATWEPGDLADLAGAR